MDKLKKTHHWTEGSVNAFVHRLSFDFVTQIYKKLQSEHIKKTEFAKLLNVTPGSVSQLLNDPGNITLETAVKYVRPLGMKVALIAYDDGDPENNTGPINSGIFEKCWHLQGAPKDFYDLAQVSSAQLSLPFVRVDESTAANQRFDDFCILIKPDRFATNTINNVGANYREWVQ